MTPRHHRKEEHVSTVSGREHSPQTRLGVLIEPS